MKLTSEEKERISKMNQEDAFRLADDTRGNYQFEIEKPSAKEYRVSKFAIMCLDVQYFFEAEDVIAFIEKYY